MSRYHYAEICNLLLNILFDLFLCGINDLLYLPLLFKPSFVFGVFLSSGALPFQLMLGLLGILILTFVESQPQNIEELAARYEYIFKTGNRNAASHLWSSYILDRAHELEPEKLELLFRGFCPVSGSPLPDDPHTRFYSQLQSVTGQVTSGITHHCCWPCICDTESAVKTDTYEIQTLQGPRQDDYLAYTRSYTFLVIGDPCAHPAKLEEAFEDPLTGEQVTLKQQAPEVRCDNGKLSGAHFSDHGHVIIGMYFVDDKDKKEAPYSDASDFQEKCQERKAHGYDSGMGAIFQKVAAINPIFPKPAGAVSFLQKWSETQGVHTAAYGFDNVLIFIFAIFGVFGIASLALIRQAKSKFTSSSESDIE